MGNLLKKTTAQLPVASYSKWWAVQTNRCVVSNVERMLQVIDSLRQIARLEAIF
jgi:hypothetical protein